MEDGVSEVGAGGGLDPITMPPKERSEHDISAEAVTDALVERIHEAEDERKVFDGITFPHIDFDRRDIESASKYPVVFRDCEFPEGIVAVQADFKLPVRFEGCRIAGMTLDQTRFVFDATFHDTVFTDAVAGNETHFTRDADFTGSTFEDVLSLEEATFAEEAFFDGIDFESSVSVRAAEFHGRATELDDHATFADSEFHDEADFSHATLQDATFAHVVFHTDAVFRGVEFDGEVSFVNSIFKAEADFAEVDFNDDVTYRDGTFRSEASFRGAEFAGGARSLRDDASFAGVEFGADAIFREAVFRQSTFEGGEFAGNARFEETQFTDDASFSGVSFHSNADFDETYFGEIGDFSDATFDQRAVFRAAAFSGSVQHGASNADFSRAVFSADVDFDDVTFTTALFEEVRFTGEVDFTGARFTDSFSFIAMGVDDETQVYVNFTDAGLIDGSITQPEGEWVRYDLTQASIGSVRLTDAGDAGNRELLDYFRFCNTEFDEFDGHTFNFWHHTDYFDRNNWVLHDFNDADPDREYALPMTNENIETTYLKAKNAASADGFIKAAGEFRVKRQQYARRKHTTITRDRNEPVMVRLRNLSRAAENFFLGATCGHGMRIWRIVGFIAIAPLLPALLYNFGGPMFVTSAGQLSGLGALTSPHGQSVFFKNVFFSYITFLTVGYGGIGPVGFLARLLAWFEVYVQVILAGLVVYVLTKRSEL